MNTMVKNIFEGIPSNLPKEIFQELARSDSVKIERILSRGQATPEGEWYDQEQNEWVLVLKGSAGLIFEGSHEILSLKVGDAINIPAHVRHRVAWTDTDETTLWLAIHYR